MEKITSSLSQSNSRFIFSLIGIIIIALAFLWFAIWQGIEILEYEWVYSQNNAVKAWQYLMRVLWVFFFCTSPAWCLFGIVLIAKFLMQKK